MAADADYSLYLARFEATVGRCEVGSYLKHNGRMIKKLKAEEFAAKWREFQEIDSAYEEIMEGGHTINDAVVKVHRERSDELVLPRKV